jgi:hypothetical protein
MSTTTTYDNLFTDRIFFGTKDSSDNIVLDMVNNNLNKKLWIELEIPFSRTPGNTSSKANFFIVKTFSSSDSQKIIDGIYNKLNFFFDDHGNIKIKDNDDEIFSFKNPLSTHVMDFSNPGNIFADKMLNGQLLREIVRKDFILNSNSKWILYTLDSVCYLLYNPLHRNSFKNFYNQKLGPSSNGVASNSTFDNLFNKYCEITSSPNNINNKSLRKYSDNACNCIRLDDCIDNAAGAKITDIKFRNSVGKTCTCIAPNCSDKQNLYIDNSSFMYSDYNSYARRIRNSLSDGKCPETKLILCSTNIDSAGNSNLVGTTINNVCGDGGSTEGGGGGGTPAPIENPFKDVFSLDYEINTSDVDYILNNQTKFIEYIKNNLKVLQPQLDKTKVTITLTDLRIKENFLSDTNLLVNISFIYPININMDETETFKNDIFNTSNMKEFKIIKINSMVQTTIKDEQSSSSLIIFFSVLIVIILGFFFYFIYKYFLFKKKNIL